MDIQYHGGTSIRITTKKSQTVTDPASDVYTSKIDLKKVDFVLASQEALKPKVDNDLFVINFPGEYEFEDCSVKGIATQAFSEASGDKSATMFRVSTIDTKVLITGNINEKLTDEQLESIGVIDILVVPVGGSGYTLDAVGAATVVRAIEPKLVIPVYFAEDGVKYEVPAASLDAFVKELGAPLDEIVDKYKIKQLPDQLTIQPLKAS